MLVKLKRDSYTENKKGIFGVLNNNTEVLCNTLELAWLNNKQSVSCIPLGQYHVTVKYSDRLGRVFHILDVPDRTDILVHRGNTSEDTYGCILPGRSRDYSALRQSALAMGDLLQKLPDHFTLEVTGII
jgi:hypothetical protein